MSPLKISTKTSLFKPLETEIDGVTYYSPKLDAELFERIASHEEAARAGDIKALHAQIMIIWPKLTTKLLKQVDLRDLRAMVEDAYAQVQRPTKVLVGDEKKGGQPGPADSPK